MARRFIKRLRQRFLDTLWSIYGQRPPAHALSVDNWLQHAPGAATVYPLREAYSVTYPARRNAGNVASVQPLLQTLREDEWNHFSTEVDAAKRLQYAAQRVVVVPNGRLISSLGLIVAPDDVQLRDLSGAAFAGLYDDQLVYEGMVAPAQRVRGSMAVLASGFSQRNYYHWTLEILPRIRQLEEAGLAPDFYCVPRRHRFHRESLELLGIPKRKLIAVGKFAHLQADELIVPSLTRGEAAPENCDFLYRRMASAYWSKADVPSRSRIYIARRRSDTRHVTNEAVLFPELRKLGFSRHFLEDYSVRQQIELFQQADFVIGPHGAGLVNLVYCNTGTKVIEIATPIRPSALFYYLAYHRQLDYTAYFGQAKNCRGDASNIEVDVAELLSHVREALSAGRSAA